MRLDPGGAGGWSEAARSDDLVLPDAQPVQVDPDGTDSDDNGHVAVLGGPDARRYQHGVLGDDVEATTLLYLERHSLRPLGRLALPAPCVFEDNRPRPVLWRERRALLTVRSGPLGGQLAIVAFAAPGRVAPELVALGEPIGTIRRWLAPAPGGGGLFAVHTPHIGGVLHRYRDAGDRLVAERLMDDVSNHVIGRHELDISANEPAGVWARPFPCSVRLLKRRLAGAADTGSAGLARPGYRRGRLDYHAVPQRADVTFRHQAAARLAAGGRAGRGDPVGGRQCRVESGRRLTRGPDDRGSDDRERMTGTG
ncbi:MAG: hypothetical protein ABIP08_11005 [Lautropia sp.]